MTNSKITGKQYIRYAIASALQCGSNGTKKMSKKERYSGAKKFSKVKDRGEPLANFAEMKTLPHVAQTLFF